MVIIPRCSVSHNECITSCATLIPSIICLPYTKPIWVGDIRKGETGFNWFTITNEIILYITLHKAISLKLFRFSDCYFLVQVLRKWNLMMDEQTPSFLTPLLGCECLSLKIPNMPGKSQTWIRLGQVPYFLAYPLLKILHLHKRLVSLMPTFLPLWSGMGRVVILYLSNETLRSFPPCIYPHNSWSTPSLSLDVEFSSPYPDQWGRKSIYGIVIES